MYTSTEDARSDLFLAGAVFVFGGLIVQILLNIVPLGRVPFVAPALAILLPLATTVLVPFLLIRYRREPWSMYGLDGFAPSEFGFGLLLGAPLVVATLAAAVVAGLSPLGVLPLTGIVGLTGVDPFARLAQWLGYGLLAVYGTVKARDAFRGEHARLADGARQIGKILGIAVAAAVVLLMLSLAARGVLAGSLGLAVGFLLMPLGVATAFLLAVSQVPAPTATSRPTLVTPAVLLGLGAFHLTFDAVGIVSTIYLTGLLALLGVVIGVVMESRRSAWAAVGLALVVATLTNLAQGAALR